jgi:hypothetical protein
MWRKLMWFGIGLVAALLFYFVAMMFTQLFQMM